MRPSIAAGLGAVLIGLVLSAVVVDGVEPVVYRPPEEARFRPVTLPSNSPMTPADPLAAPAPRDIGSWGAPDRALVALGARDDDPTAEFDRPVLELAEAPLPDVQATPDPTPRPARSSRTSSPTTWRHDPEASWYGPGFYGKRTACGLAMTTTLIGVAHRTLPCGTLIVFRNGDRTVTVPVVDRGPYVPGRIWDLTGGAAIALDHVYTGPIDWRFK